MRPAFSSWIYRIAANAAYDRARARRARVDDVALDALLPVFDEMGRHVTPVVDWSRDLEDPAVAGEVRTVLERAIEDLPEDYRVVLVLRDIEELTNEEVAEALGLTVGAVKSRLHRARLLIRKALTRLSRPPPEMSRAVVPSTTRSTAPRAPVPMVGEEVGAMRCHEFRQWSDRLLGTQPSLDRLAVAREHARTCGRCARDLDRRVQVEAWDSERREFWWWRSLQPRQPPRFVGINVRPRLLGIQQSDAQACLPKKGPLI